MSQKRHSLFLWYIWHMSSNFANRGGTIPRKFESAKFV